MPKSRSCPCESGATFEACCARFIDAAQPAPDAAHLMRSRYSAYALDRLDYLLQSWHPQTRPASLEGDAEPRAKWIGLKLMSHRQIDETHAEVEFVARYRVAGRAYRLHETSRFACEDGRWYYLDGTLHES